MSATDKHRADISATISGPVSGQVAVGTGITQTQTVAGGGGPVTGDDLRVLAELLDGLRARVAGEVPADKQPAALERVKEMEEAVTAPVPDLTTLEYVRGWFAKHLPSLAGSVTSLVVHPIVGKIVGAAGDAVVAEFRRRFGGVAK